MVILVGLRYLPKLAQELKVPRAGRTLADIVGAPVVTDRPTGQFKVPELGRADGLTDDDIKWALENGASTVQEAIELVAEHKRQVGETK